MGITSDHEIMQVVCGNSDVYRQLFANNIEEVHKAGIHTRLQALEAMGKQVKVIRKAGAWGPRRPASEEAMEALATIILAHVPVHNLNFRPKAIYIATMARRILMATHDESQVDDRDYVGNKRLELAGQLLSLLFEDLFKKFNHDLKLNIDKVLKKSSRTGEFDAMQQFKMHGNHITSGLVRAISTGNWSLKRFKMERAGVTHVLSRLSYISALGMMTRIQSQFEKTRKVSGPRALQPSQWGVLCPSDTPEGEACGLVKNLALMTHITTDADEEPLWNAAYMLGLEDFNTLTGTELYDEGSYIVSLNGTLIGLSRDPENFIHKFRLLRRTGQISEFVSIYVSTHQQAIHIAGDSGRICRPIIIVNNGIPMITPQHIKVSLIR
jgi:DNA-directed RNA polymerase III subunit RPC2